MMHNPNIQNTALLMWNGAAATARPANKHLNFGIQFEIVTGPLAAPVVFNVVAYPPSPVDPCLPDLTAGQIITLPGVCVGAALTNGVVTLPAGTPQDQVCSIALPCPHAFIGLVPVSGPVANVVAVGLFTGKLHPAN